MAMGRVTMALALFLSHKKSLMQIITCSDSAQLTSRSPPTLGPKVDQPQDQEDEIIIGPKKIFSQSKTQRTLENLSFLMIVKHTWHKIYHFNHFTSARFNGINTFALSCNHYYHPSPGILSTSSVSRTSHSNIRSAIQGERTPLHFTIFPFSAPLLGTGDTRVARKKKKLLRVIVIHECENLPLERNQRLIRQWKQRKNIKFPICWDGQMTR